ncbi:DUF2459 domain-containing protein [Acidiferrobacter sp.]|uniref:DUF2459 domain-containing protein n=1 Tax=Acidiferrobacter sp. TaxID=1872107 RepID=UPI00262CB04B|nr:DUF2459 domain-containing protein [Acidiferrobacter sp.]
MGTKRPSSAAARHTAGLVTGAITLLILAGCAQPPALITTTPGPASARLPALGVVREGWHTGLIVPTPALTGLLKSLRTRFASTPFVIIGWGQRRYYMARDPGFLMGLAALFPSASVIHIRAWRPRPSVRRSPRRIWLHLPAGGWRGLEAFLDHAFRHDRHDRLESLGAHGRPGDFFAASGTYDALHTCNTWVMQALRAARLPATGTGVLFAGQVDSALRAQPLHRFWASPTFIFRHRLSP